MSPTLKEMAAAVSDLKYYIDVQVPPGMSVRGTPVKNLPGYNRASQLLDRAEAEIASGIVDSPNSPRMVVGN